MAAAAIEAAAKAAAAVAALAAVAAVAAVAAATALFRRIMTMLICLRRWAVIAPNVLVYRFMLPLYHASNSECRQEISAVQRKNARV
jgi:hypothetical protein